MKLDLTKLRVQTTLLVCSCVFIFGTNILWNRYVTDCCNADEMLAYTRDKTCVALVKTAYVPAFSQFGFDKVYLTMLDQECVDLLKELSNNEDVIVLTGAFYKDTLVSELDKYGIAMEYTATVLTNNYGDTVNIFNFS